MWHRIRLAITLGTATILAVLAGGTAVILDRAQVAARLAADAGLERSAKAVENALNRQLLQVDGALASLPALFASADRGGPIEAGAAAQLLRGLNFQSFAFRDLTLIEPDGAVWAATRARGVARGPAFEVGDFVRRRDAGSSLLRGPSRNRVTGDWSLYLGRTVDLPRVGERVAVAEVPLPVLMRILSETGLGPGVGIAIRRSGGQLVASVPYDDLRIGLALGGALDAAGLDGRARDETVAAGPRQFVVRRPCLYDDLVVELSVAHDVALADWERDRDRLLIASGSGGALIALFAAALLAALRETQRQNAALIEREGRISFMANHDDLTKLPNRVLFRRQLQLALEGERAGPKRIALLHLNLDRFREVNDTLGHVAGDALLRAVSERLRGCLGGAGLLARLGGDEFAIVVAARNQPQAAGELSRRLAEVLRRPVEALGHVVAVAASVGIAVAGFEADADTLMKQADLALDQAKTTDRGAHCVFAPEMSERLSARLRMEADLRVAFAREAFELAYQPIYDVASGALCGFEALLRWHHPERGAVSPAVFVPIAEEMGLIAEIGTWVLRRACADFAGLAGHLRIAVNLSPLQITSGDIVATVVEALAETGLEPARLELEITETALFADDQRGLEVLRELRGLGVRMVLDDFGTGYSSLSHLHRYPLDKIKIDRSFVESMSEREDSAAIVAALAGLASRLGMSTTAEGIETPEQMALVRAAGCTQAQGYLLGKPGPVLGAVEAIARGRYDAAADAGSPRAVARTA